MKHAEYKMPGGKLLVIDLDTEASQLKHVRLSGDFFLEPPEALETINRLLEGLSTELSEDAIAQHLHTALDEQVQMYGISPQAIATVVRRALA